MLDDEINKRIREAADQYHPAYDDKAWERMEQMLDENLPQKRDRRRVLYFLIFAVLVCAGLLFIFSPRKKNPSPVSASNTISKNEPGKDSEGTGLLPIESSSKTNNHDSYDPAASRLNGKDNTTQETPNATGVANIDTNRKITSKNNDLNSRMNVKDNGNVGVNIENATMETNPVDNRDKTQGAGDMPIKNKPSVSVMADNSTKVAEANPVDNAGNITDSGELPIKNKSSAPILSENSIKTSEANGTDSTKKENINPENRKLVKGSGKDAKGEKGFANKFGISVSAGPDISGVSVSKIGKVTIAYGAGVSYELSGNFTLRTGFYIAKKIYSAGESDYHSNTVNYNYLQSIDADCKVYEIPLVVNYNFGRVKKHNWFASAGLSSYLMKKENYVYYYKYPSGNTYDKSWSVSNKNKHYFSVLDLSAGYQYIVNKRISLSAEPYLRLPLSGIGAGKIKLNSGGVLFTVSMKPFKK